MVGELPGLTAAGVQCPQVLALLRQVAVAIQLIEQAVIAPCYHPQLFLLLILLAFQRLCIQLAHREQQTPSIRRPIQAADLAVNLAQRARLAAVERDQVNLERLFLIPAVRKEGDLAAIRRPARACINLLSKCELARLAALRRDDP